MNPVEPLIWTGCAFLLLRLIQTGDTRLWLPFGLLSGVGILNKHTMLLFGFALVVGLLLTRERRLLFSRWLLLGGLLALVVILPHLVWEIRHGFPHFEVLANIRRDGRDVSVGFLQFWQMELLFLNPAAAPVWLTGLVGLFAAARLRSARVFGWAFLIVIGCLFLTTPGSHKTYYAAAAYPMLIAAGAVLIEPALRGRVDALAEAGRPGRARRRRGARRADGHPDPAARTPTCATRRRSGSRSRGSRTAPRTPCPRCSPTASAGRRWSRRWRGSTTRCRPSVRAKTGIFANDFGQGGAIDFYGPRYGLPKAIGGHLAYWYWGPRGYTGESLIVLGDRRESAAQVVRGRARGGDGRPPPARCGRSTSRSCSAAGRAASRSRRSGRSSRTGTERGRVRTRSSRPTAEATAARFEGTLPRHGGLGSERRHRGDDLGGGRRVGSSKSGSAVKPPRSWPGPSRAGGGRPAWRGARRARGHEHRPHRRHVHVEAQRDERGDAEHDAEVHQVRSAGRDAEGENGGRHERVARID